VTSRAVDPEFARRLRALRELRGLSLRDLQTRVYYGKSYLQQLETGLKPPTLEAAQRLDVALTADGELAAMVTETTSDERAQALEASDLLARMRANDATPATVQSLESVAFELCCEYRWRPAAELRGDALQWLHETVRLRRSAGLREHADLLTTAGWLGLLVGCVEYDMGMRSAAESTRTAALSLGQESGNAEIVAWAWEMAAWFALTQGRLEAAITAAEAGQAATTAHTVAVQLIAQAAKARARLGDVQAVRAELERGRHLLDQFARPSRPDHHFVVDPDKWDFYAMDAYRLVGDDELAAHHAQEVLTLGTAPDGTERAPMRMAEARLTLGVVAARSRELENAVTLGMSAFRTERRSLPTLLMVAAELDTELSHRYPNERSARDYRAALRDVS
jgi:transcriptional regulator with XRE-family HTH domain